MVKLLPNSVAICVTLSYNTEMLLRQLQLLKGNIMRFNPDSKTFKVFTALRNGDKLTPAEAKKRFGVGNLSAEASRIRSHGYAVYADQRVAGNGVKVTEYRLGTPSRKVIAAGYKAMALGLV